MKLGGSNDDEGQAAPRAPAWHERCAEHPPLHQELRPRIPTPTEQGFVPEEVFPERLPEIAKNAIGDACTGSNPASPARRGDGEAEGATYDTEVDFLIKPTFYRHFYLFPITAKPQAPQQARGLLFDGQALRASSPTGDARLALLQTAERWMKKTALTVSSRRFELELLSRRTGVFTKDALTN